MLGLVVAMNEEMELLLTNLHQNKFEMTKKIFVEYKFNLEGKDIIAVISGIGKIKASAATEYLLSNYKISKVLNFGMAGGIDKNVEIGEIVNIIKCYDNDEDLSAFGHDKVIRELVEINKFNYKKGICVTGDKFVNDLNESLAINKRYNAICYEMELSAISLICNMHKVPLISLKYISDKADEFAEFDFDESLKKATKNFSQILMNIMGNL
ncbi:MAG: 5'-methylthioadenosine/S-adenosylhomocysteine nucleosidase [Bacillota bacterium]|nr:5'-methylthioadenosine/S-adenosylhomocysteine nucleosidase [Bacillota bacterium]